MYLSQLAKGLRDALNSSSPETWGGSEATGYIVPDDVRAYYALDPFADSGDNTPRIFIIPGYLQVNVNKDRRRHVSIDQKVITLALCAKLSTVDTEGLDLCDEALVTKITDLNEELIYFATRTEVLGFLPGSVEPEPPNEVELKDRYYLAATVLAYDVNCQI